MSFKVLYVEDDEEYSKIVAQAVDHGGLNTISRPLEITPILKPDELPVHLDQNYDLVLADLLFPDPLNPANDQNRLDDIIRIVEEWSKKNHLQKPLPIIAYTRREKGALEYCLKRRDALYDIWDKASASPPYAAWRLTRIAVELSRARPDAVLERLIRTMAKGARWHDHVRDMAHRYGAGWTEADQIEGVGHGISQIAHLLDCHEVCKAYWRIMADWEPLGRAVSRRIRGHARHVINVFWLGYYLLHHETLQDWVTRSWKHLLANRKDMAAVTTTAPLEAFSDCWFYAGLFHDVANCVEKGLVVESTNSALLNSFGDLLQTAVGTSNPTKALKQGATSVLHDLGPPISEKLQDHWQKSLKENHPDHGMVIAAHLAQAIIDKEQICFAREAARGMAIHNLIAQVAEPDALLSWDDEPIASLLLLCDQIQTWDRERDDTKLSDKDGPERAELLELSVTQVGGRPKISMSIEYVAPRHLDHAPEIFQRVKDELEQILKDKPNSVLKRIKRPWPFTLHVICWLSGVRLSTEMDFQ